MEQIWGFGGLKPQEQESGGCVHSGPSDVDGRESEDREVDIIRGKRERVRVCVCVCVGEESCPYSQRGFRAGWADPYQEKISWVLELPHKRLWISLFNLFLFFFLLCRNF